MSNTEEKTNENDEKLEKVIVEEEGDQLLKNESGQDTDPNLQNDNQVDDDENELNLEDLVKERDELKDKLMRSLAESENIRKRALKDRQDAEIYAKELSGIPKSYNGQSIDASTAEDLGFNVISPNNYLPSVIYKAVRDSMVEFNETGTIDFDVSNYRQELAVIMGVDQLFEIEQNYVL